MAAGGGICGGPCVSRLRALTIGGAPRCNGRCLVTRSQIPTWICVHTKFPNFCSPRHHRLRHTDPRRRQPSKTGKMGHPAGLRAGTRYAFSRNFREKGMIRLSTYLRQYKYVGASRARRRCKDRQLIGSQGWRHRRHQGQRCCPEGVSENPGSHDGRMRRDAGAIDRHNDTAAAERLRLVDMPAEKSEAGSRS